MPRRPHLLNIHTAREAAPKGLAEILATGGMGWVGAGKIHRFQSSGPREPPDAQNFSAQAYKTARPHALRAVYARTAV